MITILTTKYSIPSARLIKDALKESGEDVVLTTKPWLIESPRIRYGNSSGVFFKDTELNTKDFIRLCSNKLLFSNFLIKHGFYAPEFKKSTDNLRFPIMIRKTLAGFKGRGIIICKNEDEFFSNWDDNYFWTEFIKLEYELRVHVIGKNLIKIFKKIDLEENEFPIRNSLTTHFSLRSQTSFTTLVSLLNKLTDLFGNSFFALDVGWDSTRKEYFIIEANSAPGLNKKTARLYADFFLRELK